MNAAILLIWSCSPQWIFGWVIRRGSIHWYTSSIHLKDFGIKISHLRKHDLMFSFGPDQTLVRRQLEASCRALAAVAGQQEPRDSSTWKSLIPGPDISQISKPNPIHLHKKAHIMNYKRETNIWCSKIYLSRQDRKVHKSSRKQSAQLCYGKIQHVRKVQRGRFQIKILQELRDQKWESSAAG
jgi:hypothetical protein